MLNKLKKIIIALKVLRCESSTFHIDSCVMFVECYGVCFDICCIRVVKLRRMIWVEHIACMKTRQEIRREFCCGNIRGRDHLKSIGM
jgi:hypothetical protein